MCAQQSDIHIARKASKKPIEEIAEKLNIPNKYQYPYGHYTCKIDLNYIENLPQKDSKLILVTAITPTPAGEGKTTTSVGLNDGLNKIGKKYRVFTKKSVRKASFYKKIDIEIINIKLIIVFFIIIFIPVIKFNFLRSMELPLHL